MKSTQNDAYQRLIGRLKKVMALANSPNPHEAAAALAKAAALMQEHGITESELRMADVEEAEAPTPRYRPTDYDSLLVTICCDVFGCAVILRQVPSMPVFGIQAKANMFFIGVRPAADLAAYCYTVLQRRLKEARREYLATISRRFKQINRTRKADVYALNWAHGCRRACMQLRPVLEPGELVQEYKQQRFPELTEQEVRRADVDGVRGGYADARAGYADGKKQRLDVPIEGGNGSPTGQLAEAQKALPRG